MRRSSPIWGLIFIVIGTLLLLDNLGYWNVDWDAVWRLWPTILIYAGLVRILAYLGL